MVNFIFKKKILGHISFSWPLKALDILVCLFLYEIWPSAAGKQCSSGSNKNL